MSEKITGIKIKKDDGTYTVEIPISVQLQNVVGAGTVANKDVAESGNASTTQVVMGNDTRLTDARIASDVYSWAKASTKPTYTPTEVGAIPATLKGANNGVAELDANGLVPSTQLPSYVDDVLEYETKTSFPTTGETGKIYVDKETNLTYRWSGTIYVEISQSLALGITSSTAFRGDYGNIAYNHAANKGSAFISGMYKITTNTEGHVTAATAIEKTDITNLGIPAQDTIYNNATTSNAGLMSAEDKTKLDGIEAGAEVNVNSDWNAVDGDAQILNKPILGTAASKDVAVNGDASITQVVMGNDTRLSDARPAADVYDWAKASIKPSYTKSEIGLGNVDNTSDATKKSNFTGAIENNNIGFVTGGDVYDAFENTVSSVNNQTGDVTITKTDLGLSNVDNTSDATKKANFTGSIIEGNTGFVTGGDVYDAMAGAGAVSSVNNKTGDVVLTKDDLNLNNVDNTSDATKKVNFTGQIADGNTGFVTGDAVYNAIAGAGVGTVTSVNNKTGAVTLTKSDLDLSNVDNTSDATKKSNFTGSIASGNTGFVTGGDIYDAFAEHPGSVASVNGQTGEVVLTKNDLGLSNVDNTADANKSVAYAANAGTVNNHTVASDVPVNAVFTDTTYENKPAAQGGTDVSLVTTGQKYNWNNGGSTASIPASATVGNTGLMTFKNNNGVDLFSVQLPLYNGGTI